MVGKRRSGVVNMDHVQVKVNATTGRTRTACDALGQSSNCTIEALIFDCDGVIVESEGIHREAYNAAFKEFQIVCPGDAVPLVWTEEFYDVLQNKVGGGKPKMRWYFGENGWPTSTILGEVPQTDEDKERLIDILQDWKTQKYKDIIRALTYNGYSC